MPAGVAILGGAGLLDAFIYGNRDARSVLVQMVGDHDLALVESEASHIRTLARGVDFLLAAVKVDDWNRDLSPWRAPAVFGDADFGDGAAATLAQLQGELLPSLRSGFPDQGRRYYLGGYSLAGLFALWAAYEADDFDGVAAVSPSAWFPGFTDFVEAGMPHVQAVYLSLGDKESKARDPVMARVGDAVRQIHAHLDANCVRTVLEWNAGNHFREPDVRMAKGFAWLLNGPATPPSRPATSMPTCSPPPSSLN